MKLHCRAGWALPLILLSSLLACTPSAFSATITVTSLADDGSAGTLRAAITSANAAPGTTIAFQSGLAGTITLGSALPPITTAMTILCATKGAIKVDGAGLYRPFYIYTDAPTDQVAFSGITIQNGKDTTTAGGGGIYNYLSKVALTNCTISSNSALDGGGIENYGGALTMTTCTVSGNTATASFGGGISNDNGGTLLMLNTIISTNTTSNADGGGLSNTNSSNATLTNCTLSGNSTPSNAQFVGGGVRNSAGASATLTSCTLSGNTSGNGGGVYNSASLVLQSCELSANTAASTGGAVRAETATSTITNCTLSGNSAPQGGGIWIAREIWVFITNCTITGNNVAGVFCQYSNHWPGVAKLTNCILYGNKGSEFATDWNGELRADFSAIGGGWAGTGNTDRDPMFAAAGLTNNGGPTKTIALQIVSPCYKGGDPASAPLTDQRGVFRPDKVSMGAFDYGTAAGTAVKPVISPNGGSVVIGSTATITSTTPNSSIYYTTDGTVPGDPADLYAGPITIGVSEKVTAIATAPGYYVSPVATASFVAVNQTPVVTSIAPSSGTAGGAAFTLTVNGAEFVNGAKAYWNGVALTTTFVNANQLTAAVPAAKIVAAGTATVTVKQPDNVASITSATFTIKNVVPAVSSIAPTSTVAGSTDFVLTVNGTGFAAGATILWNGNALVTTVASSTKLTGTVPAANVAAKGSAVVTVRQSDGVVSATSATFTVLNPYPVVSTISPSTAVAGSGQLTLTVNGSAFVSGAAVLWNGTPLTTTFVSSAKLTAVVPAASLTLAGSFPITVKQPDGVVSPTSAPFTVSGVVPVVSSIAPASTPALSAEFTLTVNGSAFLSGATVLWNGAALATTFVSATKLTAIVPATKVAAKGTSTVTVKQPDGVPSATSATFTITSALPILSAISPVSKAASSGTFTLTVNGSRFAAGAVVLWKGVALPTTVVSSAKLTAEVLDTYIAAPGTAAITVKQADGTVSATSATFKITSAVPVVTTISPSTTAAGSAAFTLTVNGSAFLSGATVLWNGAALTTTFVSDTKLTAAVPAAKVAAKGTATVTVKQPDAVLSATSAAFTITNAMPVVLTLSPTTKPAGSADFALTVNGSAFAAGATVLWNGTDLTTTLVSSAKLTAAVPAALVASPGTAKVTVRQSDGTTSTTSATFTVTGTMGVTGLTFDPPTIVAGDATTGTVTLNYPAPAGGTKVTVVFGGFVVAVVTVAPGDKTVSLDIQTTEAAAAGAYTFYATTGVAGTGLAAGTLTVL